MRAGPGYRFAHPGYGSYACCNSKIRFGRFRERKQVVLEAVVVVLGADELPPIALLLAPARYHVHRLVEGAVVLDLDQGFEVLPAVRQPLKTVAWNRRTQSMQSRDAVTSSNLGASGSNTGPGTPIVVSTLTNGKTYTCTVKATNAVGPGASSAASK